MPDLQPPNIAEAKQTDIEEALYRHLCSMGEVRELVGDSISPINASQGEVLPRITYQLIGDESATNMKSEDGAKVATFHLKSWAKDPDEAKAITKAIAGRRTNPRLAGMTWQDGLLGGLIRIAFVKIPDRAAELETPQTGSDVGEYWRLLIVVIQYYDPISPAQ